MTGFVYFPPAKPLEHECPTPVAEEWPVGSVWLCGCGQYWVIRRVSTFTDRDGRVSRPGWKKIGRRRVRRILRKEREKWFTSR